MLSDQERIVLNDIERELGANDPELAKHLTADTAAASGSADGSADGKLWRYWLAGSIVGLLMLISIAADLPVLMLLLTIAGVATVTARYLHKRKQGSG